MKKFAPLILVLAVALFASACGQEKPEAELAAAKAAVADAQASGAAQNCPDKLKAAEDELAKGEAQYAAEEYDAAKVSFAETIKLAEIAKNCPPPPPPPPPPTPKPVLKQAPATLPNVYFDYDKYNIRPDQVEKAKQNAAQIKSDHAGTKIMLVGHCDERGTDEYNMALGMRRAKSVQNFLTNMGVAANDLFVKSMGESQPLDPAHNEAAWAKNRRVEFKF
ncbi:OmpA family protein [bacterium]|nr:OmpA family protein [bacterium]